MQNSIRLDDQSSLKWIDKETWEYVEGDYVALIWVDYESGFFSRGRVVKRSSLLEWKSMPKGVNKTIGDLRRDEILNKIVMHFSSGHEKWRIE